MIHTKFDVWMQQTIIVLSILMLSGHSIGLANDSSEKGQLFQQVFGNDVVFEKAFHHRVASSTPGIRHYRDVNQDKKPEEVWFIDTHPRHPQKYRPLLVKVIDEDQDLHFGYEPDRDSDLYIADWKADGTVDAVLDYTDVDGDNDVDEMAMYFIGSGANYFPGPALRVWWGRDNGDDNLLWYNVGYTYDQDLCQYRTHFGGDETFVSFALSPEGNEWIPFFENPFMFYDHDQDGVTEEALRLSGIDEDVETMRHSFDADNDASETNPRDFDVSISTWAPGSDANPAANQRGRSNLHIPQRLMDTVSLRGIPSRGFPAYKQARHFVKHLKWKQIMLTWNDIDLNIDGEHEYDDFQERWEGVIADGNENFPQLGGPSVGPFNNRYELLTQPSTVDLYYLPYDNRIHLKNAQRSWLKVDWNLDHTADMRYTMLDTDNDGYIDHYQYDKNADGKIDDSWDINKNAIQEIQWSWQDVSTIRQPITEKALEEQKALNQALIHKIQSINTQEWKSIKPSLPHWDTDTLGHIPDPVRKRLGTSRESQYYLNTLRRDYLLCALKNMAIPQSLQENLDRLRNENTKHDVHALLNINDSIETESNKDQSNPTQKAVAWKKNDEGSKAGWESNRIAYRFDNGTLGFFGKNENRLVYPNMKAFNANEDKDVEWGIDALRTDNSPGCGGVTLYINDESYPLWDNQKNTNHQYSSRLISATNQQVTIETIVKNVGPVNQSCQVRFRCSINAGKAHTSIKAKVENGGGYKSLSLGVGLTKLQQETIAYNNKPGYLGLWGVQTPEIGRIGMGVVFPNHTSAKYLELPNEHQVVMNLKPDEWITYHIQCDWLRGRRFPYSPSADDWMNQLQNLSNSKK